MSLGLASGARSKRSWGSVALLVVLLSSIGLTALPTAANAVTTTAVPDVAGSNTTITLAGSPIREGATLAGGSTIGIGTSSRVITTTKTTSYLRQVKFSVKGLSK